MSTPPIHPSSTPSPPTALQVPAGLRGVAVTDTEVGDVRGEEGFFHYRQYSAVELARRCRFEDVWKLMLDGALPDARAREAFAAEVRPLRQLSPALRSALEGIAPIGPGSLDGLRTALSWAAAERGMQPAYDVAAATLRADALFACALTPTILAALDRLRRGLEPIDARDDLGFAANYLYMLGGEVPDPAEVRALERYLILTIDHGFNASTFTARVIASTGADLGACLVGGIGALSGPLHGGAPSRALDALDAIGSAGRIDAWVRPRIEAGERIMGFGHAVYRTRDPRSELLREVARELGGPRIALAERVERRIVEILAELKPGRRLYANVEFYAGVVMERCGVSPEMFTPTFAASRTIGWCAHVLEQARQRKIIRPAARYVGPRAPQAVPRS